MTEWLAKYWLQVLFGALLTALGALYKRIGGKVKRQTAEYTAIKEGLVAILHDRLYAECRRCIAGGSVTVEELKNIEYLYNAYHALGGNGTGTELYTRAKALKIKEEKV